MKNNFTLKPCPFCGGEAYIRVSLGSPYITAFHKKNCKIRPDTWLSSTTSIYTQIKVWNRRAGESEATTDE